jgi:drug/metabolite transporter (DMT)-like permease
MLFQVISLVGAALVLSGYVALQRRWLSGDDRLFNLLNFLGAGLLTWVAIIDQRIGFIILEGAWALLSLPGVVRGARTARRR